MKLFSLSGQHKLDIIILFLYGLVFNAFCVENFTSTQLCVRIALEVAL